MSKPSLATMDPSKRVLKRAQYEAFEFSLIESDILVRNESHADPANHEYQVTVDDRVPVLCECPADEANPGPCKHRVAVEIRQPIIDAAQRLQMATDGGVTDEDQTSTEDSEEAAPQNCDCDELLYDITRVRSNEHLVEADIVVIGISNNYRFREQLSSKVQSSFQEDEIRFSTYDAGELRRILEERAQMAFYEDAYDESALALAAAVASKDTGSARQAIDLLRKGGEIAERKGGSDPFVTEDDIEKAREEVKRDG